MVTLVLIGIIIYLSIDLTDKKNLVSLSGLLAFAGVAFLLSSNPSKVSTWSRIKSSLLQNSNKTILR